jgi:hypothetical protein
MRLFSKRQRSGDFIQDLFDGMFEAIAYLCIFCIGIGAAIVGTIWAIVHFCF